MVTRVAKLRLMLFAAPYRGGLFAAIRAALGSLVMLSLAVSLAVLPYAVPVFSGVSEMLASAVSALILIASFVVPLFTGTKMLQARAFAIFPYSPAAVTAGIFFTALISRWGIYAGAYFAVSLITQLYIEPAAGSLPALALSAVISLITVACLATTAAALTYTPFGAQRLSADALARADSSALLLGMGIFAALLAGGFAVQSLCNHKMLQSIEKPQNNIAPGSSGLGFFDYFPDTPAGVIAARAVTYWRRDPRYAVGLLALPFAGFLVVAVLAVGGVPLGILALIPLPIILFLLGWSIHNDIAMESTAIWVHVASGVKGFDDRLGRLAPVMVVGVPLLLLGTPVSVIVADNWRLLPVALGLNAALLLVGAGVSSLSSAWVVYPSTRPGESPFLQPYWSGSNALLVQVVSFLAGIILAAPTIWLAVIAVSGGNSAVIEIVTLLGGIINGLGVLAAAVLLGGYIFDRTAPELVGITEVYD